MTLVPPPGRRRLFLVPLLVIPIVAGLALAAYAASRSTDPVLLEDGDRVQVNVQVFDLRGRLLYSTRVADLPELEEVKAAFGAPFVVPTLTEDQPMGLNVTADVRPLPLDNGSAIVIGGQLVGKPVGHRISVPVLGAFEGYVERITLDRARGPFNYTMRASYSLLENVSTEEDGDVLVFDDLLRAHVVERGPTSVSLRFDVEPGDVLDVDQANFTAEVTRAGRDDQFGLYYHTQVGHEFTVRTSCAISGSVLPSGSYRVVAVDEDTIELERSPTRWPQIIGRDVVMVLEVVKVLDDEEASA